jgi:hypothetical protein
LTISVLARHRTGTIGAYAFPIPGRATTDIVLGDACSWLSLGALCWSGSASASTANTASSARAAAGGRWTAAALVPGLAKLNVGKEAMLGDIARADRL